MHGKQILLMFLKKFIWLTKFKFNVTFKNDLSDDEEKNFKNALKLVEMYDYFKSLPNEFNTLVGENGNKLSGGQSQRLGIARAIYRNTDILILDEATSALDENTEIRILNKIFNKIEDKKIISISHNENALTYCKKVLNLNE